MMTGLQHSPHTLEKSVFLCLRFDTKKFGNAFILSLKKMSTDSHFVQKVTASFVNGKSKKCFFITKTAPVALIRLSIWQEKRCLCLAAPSHPLPDFSTLPPLPRENGFNMQQSIGTVVPI